MIPNQRYFPTNLQDRSAWFDNFNLNIQVVGASLGLTPAELTSIGKDQANLAFLAKTVTYLDAYSDAIRQYRVVFTEGNIGDPTPSFPADLALVNPNPAQPTGMFERLDDFVKRIRVAPAYTDEIGALLGIIPSGGGPSKIVIGVDVPKIDATVEPGNHVNVKFVRGSSDGVQIEVQIDNAPDWTDMGRFLKSPAVLTIAQNTDHLPRSVQVRARFLSGNSAVGDWSDIATVQTIP